MTNDDCERIQSLISADLDGELDGELDADALMQLSDHLRRCPTCVGFRRDCSSLAFACAISRAEADGPTAELLDRANGFDALAVAPAKAPSVATQRTRWWGPPLFWVAVAASSLIALVSSAIWQMRQKPAPSFSLDPLLVRYANNVEAENDQQSLLRIVEMDLRTMRLELDQLELDDETRRQWSHRIETLLAQTSQLSKTPVTFTGDLK